MVVLKGHEPFIIRSIQSDLFIIEAKLAEESRTLHALPLIIKANAGEFGQELKGKIIISTDLPTKPTIEIGTVFRLKSTAEK